MASPFERVYSDFCFICLALRIFSLLVILIRAATSCPARQIQDCLWQKLGSVLLGLPAQQPCVHCISELYGRWMICVLILSNPNEQKYQF